MSEFGFWGGVRGAGGVKGRDGACAARISSDAHLRGEEEQHVPLDALLVVGWVGGFGLLRARGFRGGVRCGRVCDARRRRRREPPSPLAQRPSPAHPTHTTQHQALVVTSTRRTCITSSTSVGHVMMHSSVAPMIANQAGSKWWIGCSRKPTTTTTITYAQRENSTQSVILYCDVVASTSVYAGTRPVSSRR